MARTIYQKCGVEQNYRRISRLKLRSPTVWYEYFTRTFSRKSLTIAESLMVHRVLTVPRPLIWMRQFNAESLKTVVGSTWHLMRILVLSVHPLPRGLYWSDYWCYHHPNPNCNITPNLFVASNLNLNDTIWKKQTQVDFDRMLLWLTIARSNSLPRHPLYEKILNSDVNSKYCFIQ